MYGIMGHWLGKDIHDIMLEGTKQFLMKTNDLINNTNKTDSNET